MKSHRLQFLGFTLIELLVVIAIIGLLSTLAIVALGSARMKSRDARRLADLRQIQTAFEMYNNENNGTYPATTTVLGDTEHACLTASGFQSTGSCGGAFINFPKDPSGGYYSYSGGGTNYRVGTVLEEVDSSKLTGSVSASANGGISSDVVGLWKFEEGGGTTAIDSSGKGNTGILHGSPLPTWGAGKIGRAMVFDGATDYVSVSSTKSIDFPTGDFSLSAWIKTSSGYQRIVSKFDLPVYHGWLMDIRTSSALRVRLTDDVGNNVDYYAGPSLLDGSWHLVAVSIARNSYSGLKLYVDGNEVGSTSTLGLTGSLGNALPVGIATIPAGPQLYFNGSIDEVTIYNRALSSGEIQVIYNQQK